MTNYNMTLSDVSGAIDQVGGPLLSWKWVLDQFPEIDGRRLPNFYCTSINLPFPQIAEKTKSVAATTVYLAGASQIQSFDMELFEDDTAQTIDYFQAWQDLIQNPQSGGYFPAANYKRNLKVALMNTKSEVIGEADLISCFPLGVQNLPLNHSGGDTVKPSVNIACDAVIFNRANRTTNSQRF